MKSTLSFLYKAKGLLAIGLPVYYKNPAIPDSVGSGVIVAPPADVSERTQRYLAWWEGTMTATSDPMMQAFTNLVGPEMGQASGFGIRMAPILCLEIDISKEEGKRALLAWAETHGGTGGLNMASDPEALMEHCWKLV